MVKCAKKKCQEEALLNFRLCKHHNDRNRDRNRRGREKQKQLSRIRPTSLSDVIQINAHKLLDVILKDPFLCQKITSKKQIMEEDKLNLNSQGELNQAKFELEKEKQELEELNGDLKQEVAKQKRELESIIGKKRKALEEYSASQKRQKISSGNIYIVQPKEYAHENIFKIGKSTTSVRRMNAYKKNSEVMLMRYVANIDNMENLIKNIFKFKFIQRRDIGYEYFEGNIRDMINVAQNTIDEYDSSLMKNVF